MQGGFLRPKREGSVVPFKFIAGTVIVASDLAEETGGGFSYVIMKSIKVLVGGTFRVSFDLKSVPTGGAGRIFVNNIERGIERIATTSYVTFTEDIKAKKDDNIQLCVQGYEKTVYVANFKLGVDSEVFIVS